VKRTPLTLLADPSRELPATLSDRLDHIHRALDSLDHELGRLERLGFELPLARGHEARRYWSFLHGLHESAAHAVGALSPRRFDREWRAAGPR
jgi:hypothetical protein